MTGAKQKPCETRFELESHFKFVILFSFQIYVATLPSFGEALAEPAASCQWAAARLHRAQARSGAGWEARTPAVSGSRGARQEWGAGGGH